MSLIKKDFISSSKYSLKCPHTMNPIGIAIHNTYNDAPAKNEASYMKNNDKQVSFHVAIDDKEAIQVIPFSRNAWACGDGGSGTGNRKYISIEICYSKSGGEKFEKAEILASKVVAEICKEYGWGIDRIKAHKDFSGKNCPHRTNMNDFKAMVSKELKPVLEKPVIKGYGVKVFTFGTKEKAQDFQAKLKQDYNAYSEIYEIK